KVERARIAIERESQQAASQRLDTALSIGATLAGALLGQRMRRRAGRTFRSAGRSVKQGQDIARARESYAAAVTALSKLDAQFQTDALRVQAAQQLELGNAETVAVKPARDGVDVKLL